VKLTVHLPAADKAALGAAVMAATLVLLLAGPARMRASRSWAMPLTSIALLGLALVALDRRDPWQKFIENDKVPQSLLRFVDHVPNLYWEGGVELLWFKLGHPSYYSCIQGTGSQFYRRTAMEFERRSVGLAGLNTGDFGDIEPVPSACAPKQYPEDNGPGSEAQLTTACRALPELDAIVLTTPLPAAPYREWHAPVSQLVIRKTRVDRIDRFYVYRCADFRRR
jgi:hypothetical protein